MKTLNVVVKVLATLAAIAGVVYLLAAYGDKVVAWAKRVIGCCPWDEGMEEEAPAAEETPVSEETPVAAEEAPVEEPVAEETPAVEESESNEPIADEGDFEG